jgi:alpha-1,3-rhamnosyltransferase
MDVKENNQPLVSIIVPSYNHSRYITQCIESIMHQTYINFELVVIDDGSKDDTRSVLEDLQLKYNFNLVFQENHGVAYTLNRGIKEFATGKYLTFCASDDYWALDKLEKQVQFMEANQFYPMCYGKMHYVNEDSDLLSNLDVLNDSLRGGLIFDDIFMFKVHPPVNYLFRKRIFEEIGFYDETILAEDYYMNLKISSIYPIGFIDDFLGYYRYDPRPVKASNYDKVSDSHLQSIEKYRFHCLYRNAITMVYLRKFEMFSAFRILKAKAFFNGVKSIRFFYKKLFIKSTIKLLFLWK